MRIADAYIIHNSYLPNPENKGNSCIIKALDSAVKAIKEQG